MVHRAARRARRIYRQWTIQLSGLESVSRLRAAAVELPPVGQASSLAVLGQRRTVVAVFSQRALRCHRPNPPAPKITPGHSDLVRCRHAIEFRLQCLLQTFNIPLLFKALRRDVLLN